MSRVHLEYLFAITKQYSLNQKKRKYHHHLYKQKASKRGGFINQIMRLK